MNCISKALLFVLILLGFNLNGQTSYEVNFKSGTVTPEANISLFDNRTDILEEELVNGKYYRFIQFEKALSSNDIKELENKGISLLNYIPNLTYLASIPQSITNTDLTAHKVRSIWKIGNEQRLHADIVAQSLPEWSIDGGDALLIIRFHKDLSFDLVANRLIADKIKILGHNGYNNYVNISVPLDRAQEIADLPYISGVTIMPPPAVKEDRRGRSLHRVNRLNPNDGTRGYSGQGINILVRDDGALFDHPDFEGRVDQSFVGVSRGDHGDGVAGIMGGAGNLDPINRGMAFGSQVFVTDYEATFNDETMSLFTNQDVIVTNSSYSNGCNAGYTFITETVDQQVFDNPTLLHVFSAGNSGQGIFSNDEVVECGYGAGLFWANITGGHKIGKNVIATANLNFRGEIMLSSSRGPSRDGRIKPDISANGNNHVSTAEENGYFSFGGTSGASPVVAGVTAMLHEAYESLNGTRATSALLKATMLNTANDLGNKGPDYIHGWGNLNAHRAALLLEEGRHVNSQIESEESNDHVITIPDNVAEVKIMTYWPDPEANSFSSTTLINDLNTSVTNSTGEEHLPWFLDPTPDPIILNTPATKTGGDFLNNMEQISIDNPTPGEYTLTVSGDNVPFGQAEYYVVWEFRMNEIDLIFPNGGENLRASDSEVIHWDATGDEGEFEVSYVNELGEETPISTVAGNLRLLEWFVPSNFDEHARIKITRGDVTGMSEADFLIADLPSFLFIAPDSIRMMTWNGVPEAVSYNIYALGEKFMENMTTVESDSFLIPQMEPYKSNWLAVSANFPDGSEGVRSRAISSTEAPFSIFTNDQENKPCINRPVVFESQSEGEDLDYNWQFGSNAFPGSMDTEGPHTVIFTKKGINLASLTVVNNGGSNNDFVILNVEVDPEDGETTFTKEGVGRYTCDTDIKFADDYFWDFGDGTILEGKNVNYEYTESGEYTITLTAENKCGAIIESETIFVDLTSAVEDLTISDFRLSPNPNVGKFEISLPDLEGNSALIKLVSVDGKLIDSRVVDNPKVGQKIGWNDIQSGIYFLDITIGNEKIVERVVVNRL